MKRIIIGARASPLSACQAETVIKLLKKKFPKHNFILKKITTLGDKTKNWQRRDKGIFVKEIEEALLEGKIDLAVHSLKDLPSQMPQGLKLIAVTKREDPRDILIVRDKKNLPRSCTQGRSLSNLKAGAVIGTGSLRRASQLLRWRKDLRIENLRGNLDTRIRKLQEGKFDAIVVAAAGIKRLGYKNLFSKFIPAQIMLPAVGQGALGLQIRSRDKIMEGIAKKINDPKAFLCVKCERAFLKEIGGGCRLPLGALAQIKNNRIYLDAAIISIDGKRMVRISRHALLDKVKELGKSVAEKMLVKGGGEILRDAKKSR